MWTPFADEVGQENQSLCARLYPCRLGITTPAGHLPPQPDVPLLGESAAPWVRMVCPRSRRYLPLEEYTFAEAFRDAGYATAFVGKWHLGHEPWWPKKQGFDVNIAGGHYPGPPSYFSPYRIKTLPDGPKGEYITDRLTDEALRYLEGQRGRFRRVVDLAQRAHPEGIGGDHAVEPHLNAQQVLEYQGRERGRQVGSRVNCRKGDVGGHDYVHAGVDGGLKWR